ncbi:sensor histidine kinase [Actinomadura macrotermitis]|uniref:histidine kinase n=1 Tax=Actinomadura macrotermitis TaxID=2585200 RepID=A0A7K0C4B5_9ACTN|nr:ATP-binding protein [Actinomadura macrotermitis]MQY08275.1 Adaptive-response sensory-kinase SasA [Actinomadura macrotermitis]
MRLRTTLAATLTVAVALALASFALLTVLQGSLERSARDEAARRAKAEAVALRRNDGDAADGVRIVGGSEPADAWRKEKGYVVVNERVTADGRDMVVQVRTSLAPAKDAIKALRNLLVPGVPALLLLVALLTWVSVGRVLKPVSAIRARMAEITVGDLGRRVPEPGSRDEIAALARTVNATLDRLQSAVERHKRFVADAAHELRSPLAILRTRLELAGPGEALTDVERLQRLTADLLLLARLDAGEPLRDEEVDLGQVVAEEAARPRPRPDVAVALDVAADVLVTGSDDRLRRLVANLVDNAVRHASSAVAVRLAVDGPRAVLEVTDDGPGIPAEHHATVFDRFTRLDEARARDTGGSGLGLAIAREIATAHGGTLEVIPATPGAHLRAEIPLPGPR